MTLTTWIPADIIKDYHVTMEQIVICLTMILEAAKGLVKQTPLTLGLNIEVICVNCISAATPSEY